MQEKALADPSTGSLTIDDAMDFSFQHGLEVRRPDV